MASQGTQTVVRSPDMFRQMLLQKREPGSPVKPHSPMPPMPRMHPIASANTLRRGSVRKVAQQTQTTSGGRVHKRTKSAAIVESSPQPPDQTVEESCTNTTGSELTYCDPTDSAGAAQKQVFSLNLPDDDTTEMTVAKPLQEAIISKGVKQKSAHSKKSSVKWARTPSQRSNTRGIGNPLELKTTATSTTITIAPAPNPTLTTIPTAIPAPSKTLPTQHSVSKNSSSAKSATGANKVSTLRKKTLSKAASIKMSVKPPPRKKPPPPGMATCRICSRNFMQDRLRKHEAVCHKMANTRRKVFDASKQRVRGTDAESYQAKPLLRSAAVRSVAATPKPTNWRIKHEDFIATIRAAKEYQNHVAKGGKPADIPPPKPFQNPDYIKCPHCLRRFNQAAAERHIPKCLSLRSNKPPNLTTFKPVNKLSNKSSNNPSHKPFNKGATMGSIQAINVNVADNKTNKTVTVKTSSKSVNKATVVPSKMVINKAKSIAKINVKRS